MIHSFIFNEGKVAGQDLDLDAVKLVLADKGLMVWLDLECPTEEETKQVLEGMFNFHPLAIEDCMATDGQLPKLDDYDDYLFLIMPVVHFSRSEKFSVTEVDIFIGRDFLVTFHKTPVHSIQNLRERFAKRIGPAARTSDKLAHSVMDVIMDHYTPVMYELTSELDELEDSVLGQEKMDSMSDILDIRQDLSRLRQIVRPQREVMNRLCRGGASKLIRTNMQPYFGDLHDALTRIDDTVSSYTERLLFNFDVYMNRSSFEANEGIKVLTALTAIPFLLSL